MSCQSKWIAISPDSHPASSVSPRNIQGSIFGHGGHCSFKIFGPPPSFRERAKPLKKLSRQSIVFDDLSEAHIGSLDRGNSDKAIFSNKLAIFGHRLHRIVVNVLRERFLSRRRELFRLSAC